MNIKIPSSLPDTLTTLNAELVHKVYRLFGLSGLNTEEFPAPDWTGNRVPLANRGT
jgi:hypothetical protein